MKYQAKIPTVFTNMLVSKLGKISNKTVLVIRDWYTAVFLAKNNKVLFVTDDPEAEEKFRLVVIRNINFGNDDAVILINTSVDKKGNIITDSNAWLNWLKGINMKFDVAIMNPPYDGSLHLKILSKVIPLCDKVVNISPIRWLQDPFAKYIKSSDYNKFEEFISKKIETLQIIDADTANKIFVGAKFTINLGIYVCGNGGFNYDMETPLNKKIINKVKQSNWLPYSPKKFYLNQIPNKQFKLDVAPIHGNSNELDCIMCKEYNIQCQTVPMNEKTAYNNQGGHFEFDTEIERHNFYDCYCHRFMIWYYRLWKFNTHVYSEKLPYFNDYTKPWTTKMFCDYFNINGYIDDEHAVPGSEWEEIMKQW